MAWAFVHEADGPKGRVYGISFPDFPGVVSGGRTVDEAVARGRETLAFHVEGMIEDDDAMPSLRSLEELRGDKDVAREMRDVKRVCLVEVPFELPGKPEHLHRGPPARRRRPGRKGARAVSLGVPRRSGAGADQGGDVELNHSAAASS